MVQREIFDRDAIAVPVRRQNVRLRGSNIRRLVKPRPEKAARQLILAAVPVHLGKPLVVILDNGRAGKRQLMPWTVRGRNVLEKELGRQAESVGVDLIANKRSPRRHRGGVHELSAISCRA